MSKPIIGITPGRSKEDIHTLKVHRGIQRAIEELGGEIRILNYDTLKLYELIGEVVQLDGMIFAGGGDVAPAYYGEEVLPGCGAPDEKRDNVELNLFPLLMTRGVPILGICRGCQVINVAFGGTLIQDLPNERGVDHSQDDFKGAFHHLVTLRAGTKLANALGTDSLMTNSYHHQAVKDLAPGFVLTGMSDDGVIEAFEDPAPGRFIMGVQWHPESTLDNDEYSHKIFKLFMDEAAHFKSIPCH